MYFGAWRVNGSLSVSRAIGDAEHKPYISGEPDVEEFNMEGNGYFKNQSCFQTVLKCLIHEFHHNWKVKGRQDICPCLYYHPKEDYAVFP